MKSLEPIQGAFITAAMADRARRNAQTDPWCAEATRGLIAKAAPWHGRSDAELWDLMFGPTITRARVVDADGCCPVCNGATPMYTWKVDALHMPWKVACPHCGEQFPKNDFYAYYRSGLDVHGVFDPKLPDRRLLVNRDHPDPADPLHQFGVDDGEGYSDGQRRWRFVGTAPAMRALAASCLGRHGGALDRLCADRRRILRASGGHFNRSGGGPLSVV